MNIIIKSRQAAHRDSFNNKLSHPTAIISISTPGDKPNTFAKQSNLKKVLYLSFHDVGNRDSSGICMSTNDANKVADFVNYCINNNIEELWVHCDAGISRSAGVAAAIMKYLNGDDSPIYDNPRYRPNSKCYYLTLTALMEKVH